MMRLLVFVAIAAATSFQPHATRTVEQTPLFEALSREENWQLNQNGPCATTLDDGSQINLAWMLAGLETSLLKVEDKGFVFTYSPCTGLKCGDKSRDESENDGVLCRTDNKGKTFLSLGLLGTATFKTNISTSPANISIQYHDPVTNLSSLVHLVCTPNADVHSSRLVVEAQFNASFFQFSLLSPCACPGGCQPWPGMSVGTILVLTFFSLSLLYFGIGFFFKKAVFGAQGAQALPHSKFWTSLPGLIKDGYLFFISPCLGQSVEYKYYDRL